MFPTQPPSIKLTITSLGRRTTLEDKTGVRMGRLYNRVVEFMVESFDENLSFSVFELLFLDIAVTPGSGSRNFFLGRVRVGLTAPRGGHP